MPEEWQAISSIAYNQLQLENKADYVVAEMTARRVVNWVDCQLKALISVMERREKKR